MDYSPLTGTDTKPYNDLPTRSTFQQSAARRMTSRWWLWELLGITTCVACLLGVAITLRVFNGKPLPDIPFGISLNTIASLLGTGIKTTLLLVVSSALSQLKWLWFHRKERELQDIQVFDEASRGPWGAMVMLKTSGFSLGSFGAVIVLLLLVFDPFIQQLITTPQRQLSTLEKSTAVKRALTFNQSAQLTKTQDVNAGTTARLSGITPDASINIAVAIGANSNAPVPEFAPYCPTAQCEWPVFTSLGLCSTCTNVTDYARQNWQCQSRGNSSRDCNYKLPNSMFNYTYFSILTKTSKLVDYEVGGELRQRIWTTRLTETQSEKNIFMLLSRVSMENSDNLNENFQTEQIREATECTLSMCVAQHKLAVDHGLTNHTIESIERPFMVEVIPSNSLISYDIKPATVRGVEYTADGQSTLAVLADILDRTFTGNVTTDYTSQTKPGEEPRLDGGITPSSDMNYFFYTGLNFTMSVENIASSVSGYIRSLSPEVTTGNSLSSETYIHVRWEWISFPVVLVAGGLLLLALAMLETRSKGVEVWKYSCLPLLFHGINNGGGQRLGTTFSNSPKDTVKEMEEDARRIRVRLARDSSSGAWMLHREQKAYELTRI